MMKKPQRSCNISLLKQAKEISHVGVDNVKVVGGQYYFSYSSVKAREEYSDSRGNIWIHTNSDTVEE